MTGREAALQALDLARDAGLSAEAYYGRAAQLQIRCFEGKVEHFEQAEGGGLGVRAVRDGRAGTAYTEVLSTEGVAEAFRAAAEAVDHVSSQDGVLLSDWPPAPELEGLEAPEIAALEAGKKIEMALAAEAAARAAGSEIINVPWTGYSETSVEVFLANTEGLQRSRRASSAGMHVQALAARGDERKSYHDFCLSRHLADFDPAGLGRTAGETAISLLGAEQPPSGKATLLFSPRPFSTLLAMFSSLFSGRSVEEKRSPLAGRLGEKIGADGLDLIDDALAPGAPASRPFDGEGVPCRRLPLVENGRLKAFMHTAETARRAGVEPTGHGMRGYRGGPGVTPSNLIVPAGGASPEELRARADIEIIAVIGGAGANQVSGEFSLPMLGFRLKDGERDRPLHNFTVAGSFEGLLKGVVGIGSDFEFALPGMTEAFGSGSALVSGLSIAGSRSGGKTS